MDTVKHYEVHSNPVVTEAPTMFSGYEGPCENGKVAIELELCDAVGPWSHHRSLCDRWNEFWLPQSRRTPSLSLFMCACVILFPTVVSVKITKNVRTVLPHPFPSLPVESFMTESEVQRTMKDCFIVVVFFVFIYFKVATVLWSDKLTRRFSCENYWQN